MQAEISNRDCEKTLHVVPYFHLRCGTHTTWDSLFSFEAIEKWAESSQKLTSNCSFSDGTPCEQEDGRAAVEKAARGEEYGTSTSRDSSSSTRNRLAWSIACESSDRRDESDRLGDSDGRRDEDRKKHQKLSHCQPVPYFVKSCSLHGTNFTRILA